MRKILEGRMKKTEMVFSFDIGWAFHGWGVKLDSQIDTGVYGFEHENYEKEYAELRRKENRKKSEKARRETIKDLIVETGLFSSKKELEKYLKKSSHKNKMWEKLRQSHKEKIDPKEFVQILYRFAKRRHYVDMRKKVEFKKSKNSKDKEEGEIKKALSKIEEIYQSMPNRNDDYKIKTWFVALSQRREEVVNGLKKILPELDKRKFPYTNKKLKKIFSKEDYKKIEKKLTGYELLLKNEYVVDSLEKIASFQREIGNKSPIFSEEFMKKYRTIVAFKGHHPSLSDKIGLCLSGTGKKRHPQSSIDAEITRIKERYFDLFLVKDESSSKEVRLSELGIDFDTYYNLVVNLSKDNASGEITVKKLISGIKKQDKSLKDKHLVHKNFAHKSEDAHDKSIALRLPGHRRLFDMSESFRNIFMQDEALRDEIEFEMLCYRDPDTLKEMLQKILDKHGIAEHTQNDIEMLALSSPGKPAPCNNETYRAIQEGLEQGKSFQEALVMKYSDALVNVKRHFRKSLSYKLYKSQQKLRGINNPFQNKVVEEFIFLFNRLVQKYGNADRIVLETTRAILSEREKEDVVNKIKDNEKLNRKIEEVLNKYVEKYQVKPAKKARERLKLFVQQGGELKFGGKEAKCILTGNPISLEAAIEGDRTNTDHIIPQTWIHDNRLENKMLMDKAVNQSDKEDMTPIQYLVSKNYTLEAAEETLKENIKDMKLSKTKKKHIFEKREKETIKKDAENRIHSMDQRMKGVQDASIKVIMDLLVDQYDFNVDEKLSLAQYREKILPVTGKMTSIFRRGWLPWYKKRREYYDNHAVDALVMLNFDRSFLTHYVTFLKQAYLEDKDLIWIAKEKLYPTIENFSDKVKSFVDEYKDQSRIVYRRAIQKYRGKTYQELPRNPKEKHAVLAKKHYFVPASGFEKLIFYKTKKINRGKEIDSISAIKFHPALRKQKVKIDKENIIAEAYRYSLLYVKTSKICGYFYLIGYSAKEKQETIELTPVNRSLKNKERITPDITAKNFGLEVFVKDGHINGKRTNPHCHEEAKKK